VHAEKILRADVRVLLSNRIILLLSLDISNRGKAGRKYRSDITSNISLDGREKRGREGSPVFLMYFDRTPQFDQINISNRMQTPVTIQSDTDYARILFIYLFYATEGENRARAYFIIHQSAFYKKHTCHLVLFGLHVFSAKLQRTLMTNTNCDTTACITYLSNTQIYITGSVLHEIK